MRTGLTRNAEITAAAVFVPIEDALKPLAWRHRSADTSTLINLWSNAMAISLYDITVTSFLQVLGGVAGVMDKGAAHCKANNIDLQSVVETRLIGDMLPFAFQIASVAHHSLGALAGAQAGVFRPPTMPNTDYAGLQNLVAEARAGLSKLTREEVEALQGKDMVFELGANKLPFTAEGFLMSFSTPNLHFHATTTYDMLRIKGVPLGKRDYLGQMRMKT